MNEHKPYLFYINDCFCRQLYIIIFKKGNTYMDSSCRNSSGRCFKRLFLIQANRSFIVPFVERNYVKKILSPCYTLNMDWFKYKYKYVSLQSKNT